MVLKPLKPISNAPFLWQLATAMVEVNKGTKLYSWEEYLIIMIKRSRLSDESVVILKKHINSLEPNAFPTMLLEMPEDLNQDRPL